MRGFIAGVVTVIVIALISGFILLRSGLIPANADGKPGGLELWAADTSLTATLRREAPKQANPVALSDASLSEGINLYGQHCALCHGTAAGDASASPVAKGLYPAPPQFATEGVEEAGRLRHDLAADRGKRRDRLEGRLSGGGDDDAGAVVADELLEHIEDRLQ